MALSFLYRAFARVLQLVQLSCFKDSDLAVEVVIRSTVRRCSRPTGRC